MGAPDILNVLRRIGLNLSANGPQLYVSPKAAITDDARKLILEHKAELLQALAEPRREQFEFSPPADPANDAEALEERAAIIAEGCGMDQAQALQEARWQADRERCWRAFLRNAQRILEAPAHKRDRLLSLYRIEAARRYGQAAGANMAKSLECWIRARAVH